VKSPRPVGEVVGPGAAERRGAYPAVTLKFKADEVWYGGVAVALDREALGHKVSGVSA
jgi:hypothetical protein